MEYGIQLYSIRDLTEKNMDEALRRVSELGYKFVEFAGFFGIPAEEIKEMLEKYNLRVSGTHTSWEELAYRFEETVAYHKAIGNKHIIIPGGHFQTQARIDAFVKVINEVQPKLAAEGITLGYHNHACEFLPNKDGSNIEDQLIYRTNIELEIDTYWAFVGKTDPVAVLDRLGDRVKVIHIKDGDANGHGTPLGMGEAPVAAVYAKAVEMGIPMVVESETCKPDGITEAKICIEYLRSLEK